MKKNALFEKCLADVPQEIQIEVRLNIGIANKIADSLKAKNMTQRDLAEQLGKRESEISRWLTGAHGFTTKTLAKISAALGEDIIEINKERPVRYVFVPYAKYVSSTEVGNAVFSNVNADFVAVQLS